jgi:DNA processing protein
VRTPVSGFDPPPGAEPDADARRRIVSLLGAAPVPVDEIVRQSGLPPASVQLVLLELELAGRLDRHAGGRVSLA